MKPLILLFTSGMLTACAGRIPDCATDVFLPEQLLPLNTQLLDTIPQGNSQRELAVIKRFEAIDCPLLQTQYVDAASQRNVMCSIAGESDHEILVGAHYDQHAAGQGVIDNWTGITVMLHLTSYYLKHPPEHTIRFVGFAGEEGGMLGSKAYVQAMDNGDVPRPRAMINLDSLGLTPLKADSRSNRTLRCLANSAAGMHGEQIGTSNLRSLVSDWAPFRRKGIAVLGLLGMNSQALRLVHTDRDQRSQVNISHMEQSFQVIATTLESLDKSARLLSIAR